MSEEEKKAIDILLNEVADIVVGEYCTHCKICDNEDMECYYIKAIDIVYKLVLKQQKEIEELKQNRDEYKEEYIKLLNARYYNYISKDKIREIRDKAEVMDYYSLNDVIDDLSKLIGDYEEDE